MTTWFVRAGAGSKNVEEFLEHSVVALGDEKLGKLPPTVTKEQLLALYAQHYPDWKEGTRQTWASQFMRFVHDFKEGDRVVTFDRDRRLYLVGQIEGPYDWKPNVIAEKPHIRRVKWLWQVARDSLSTATRNTLGAIQTLFKLSDEAAKDLDTHRLKLGEPPPPLPPPQNGAAKKLPDPALFLQEENKAAEAVEDLIAQLDWDDMQELIAGVLRVIGYKTRISARGSDRGVDIFASPDGLGLQEPRIFVEVKHRQQTQIGASDIRSFVGGRKPGDRCLYVSTGGFSKEARYEAERSQVPLTLISLPDLRLLVTEHYDTLDGETKQLVPLKKIHWPA